MVKLIPYMFQDGSLSLPNLTLCFAICVSCVHANSSEFSRYIVGNGFDSLNILVMFVIFKEY